MNKEYKRLVTRIDIEPHRRLRLYALNNNISLQKIVENLIKHFLVHVERISSRKINANKNDSTTTNDWKQ